jgi:hypothetical protein
VATCTQVPDARCYAGTPGKTLRLMATTLERATAADDPRALLGRCLEFLMAQRRGFGVKKPSALEDDVRGYLERHTENVT